MAADGRTPPAGVVRDQYLRLVDGISEIGDRMTATKHGQPVAIVGSAHHKTGGLWGFMEGTTRILVDLNGPAVPLEDWGIVSNPDRVLAPKSIP